MINHARTLLLNLAAAPGSPGEEYVPRDFIPIGLTAELARADQILFGADPDRVMRNLRIRQILSPIHACELRDYLTDLDPRITYWPPYDQNLFRGLTFGAGVVQTGGTDTTVYLEGQHTGLTAVDGHLAPSWRVTITGASSYSVVRTDVSGSPGVTGAYTTTGGLSSSLPLYGAGLSLKFIPVSAPYPVWEVKALLRPADSTQTALGRLGEIAGLFADGEPYTTFRRLSGDSNLPGLYRYAGTLLALVYRLDEIFQESRR